MLGVDLRYGWLDLIIKMTQFQWIASFLCHVLGLAIKLDRGTWIDNEGCLIVFAFN